MRRTFALEDELARVKLEEVAARSALADEVRARVSAEALQGYSRAEEEEEDGDDDVVYSGGASARGGPGGAQRKTKVGKMDDDEDIVIMDEDDAPAPARGAGASKRQALDPDRALEGALERHAATVSRCQVRVWWGGGGGASPYCGGGGGGASLQAAVLWPMAAPATAPSTPPSSEPSRRWPLADI